MRCFIVDAFSDVPFKGNPAAVCIVESALEPARMLAIAREFNLSETAFVQVGSTPDAHSIRYFSPKTEIPLCGHATLASAKVLLDADGLEEVRFRTQQSLELVVRRSGSRLEMEFPVFGLEEAVAPPALVEALGLEAVADTRFNPEMGILLIEIENTDALRRLEPDFGALLQSHDGINGVVVTAAARGDGYDFHSRYFWPWSGTNEDPVTGGTHTFLAPYWSARLGKTRMQSFQSSARTGSMEVELLQGQLLIRSYAVLVFEGRLRAI